MDPNDLKTDKIPEAVVATEKKEEPVVDLHAALSEATETKAPQADKASDAWDFSKVDSATETVAEPGTEEPAKKEEAKEPKASAKVSEEVRKASAETATMMFDQLLQLTGNFAVNNKFKKKLTADEQKRVLEKDLEDCELDALEEEDRILKKKFDRLIKNRDKKIKNIPLDADETKRCETSFNQYLKEKNIEVPSEYLLAFTLITILADRTIEVYAD